MTSDCDGCGAFADVVAVYEGDDPSTGYVGSDEPEFLCWECRHPFTEQIVSAERRANALAWISHHWVEPHEYHQNSADKGT